MRQILTLRRGDRDDHTLGTFQVAESQKASAADCPSSQIDDCRCWLVTQGAVENKTTEPIDVVILGGGGALLIPPESRLVSAMSKISFKPKGTRGEPTETGSLAIYLPEADKDCSGSSEVTSQVMVECSLSRATSNLGSPFVSPAMRARMSRDSISEGAHLKCGFPGPSDRM